MDLWELADEGGECSKGTEAHGADDNDVLFVLSDVVLHVSEMTTFTVWLVAKFEFGLNIFDLGNMLII